MKIVMIYSIGDGCTYHCEETIPIEYESCEAALCDFESALQKAGYGEFEFAGRKFSGDHFYDCIYEKTRQYFAPDFLTVDEWFMRK